MFLGLDTKDSFTEVISAMKLVCGIYSALYKVFLTSKNVDSAYAK